MISSLKEEKENLNKLNAELSEEKISLKEQNDSLKKEVNRVTAERKSSPQKLRKREVAKTPDSTASNKKATKSADSNGWVKMTVNASAYTMVANGDKLGGTGLTSTGKVPTANRTIAVDPKVIPYGSQIQYNGVTYIAEDTGGMIKGYKVDIFMNTLQECNSFGRRNIEILVKFK